MNSYETEQKAPQKISVYLIELTDASFCCYLRFLLLFMSITKIFRCLYREISLFCWTDNRKTTDRQIQLLNPASNMHSRGTNCPYPSL